MSDFQYQLKNISLKIGRFFKKVLYPEDITCNVCGKDLNKASEVCLCDECKLKLPYNNGKKCVKCGKPLDDGGCPSCQKVKHKFKNAFSPFVFDGEAEQLIKQMKFQNKKYIARTFGFYMAQEYFMAGINVDAILSVPLTKKRFKHRGFDQSHKLLIWTNRYLGLEDISSAIIKSKDTLAQHTLGFRERKENLKNAFKVMDKSKIKDKKLLLVDDIFTTGLTVDSVCAELLKAGALEIYVLVAANKK